ncbi:hypothetical protein ASPACDRAFT_110561 [Aspergillus aculeatus ATCC 16872]|uniref:L-ornithine N(5)-monooxygenase n=1 Tax=Aspergillus aculeatus (strain ATCC 16872 / CBS 172.66 / WB 5094) TaxID=690307 RepID=A0A1L9X9W7_ASPA1|nr:uncharacterized protein ASPACDRAFT_110561 [Aspergillus aculeatus ATCC 16872]OJK05220.1 hypothetical protein ASPACDRAFT_110561 [Aspergillus aculeatus ATCC 16872]
MTTPPLHSVLIIGAGPCGLAVAARLREETPSAMFTDDEHQRYHWINKHRGRMALVQAHARRRRRGVRAEKYVNTASANLSTSALLPGGKGRAGSASDSASEDGGGSSGPVPGLASSGSSISSSSSLSVSESTDEEVGEEDTDDGPGGTLVLDGSGPRWMEKWNRAFRTLEIEQLRSPMFFHVDPRDRDGMLAYTQEKARLADLWEISGCVGKELSKHRRKKLRAGRGKPPQEPEIDERDRKDYFSPSTGLFADYCASIVARYRLDRPGLIRQSEVTDIQYGFHRHTNSKIFTVTAADGTQHHSRAVVLAIGPGTHKILPFPLTPPEQAGACHSSEIRSFPSANIQTKIRARQATHVVVVGGGLTAAQVADMAIRRGVRKVWLLMRSDMKVKHFDLTLNWMGKFKNLEKARFWSADTDDERLAMIAAARGGGSVTPRYQKILKQHAARSKLAIHPRTVIVDRLYDPATSTWTLTTDPPIPELADTPVDYIYFATGMRADITEMPLLNSMRRDYPVETRQGLPCLTEDLMWCDGVPLFLAGRLAALRLGPGAANLEGARLGAERIAWAMEDVLGRRSDGGGGGGGDGGREEEEGEVVGKEKEWFCGLGNRFAGLGVVDA